MDLFNAQMQDNVLIGPPMPNFLNDDLVKSLYETLREAGDQIMMTNTATGETKTANQIIEEVKNLVVNLRDLAGVAPGDVVVVSSDNNIEIDVVVIAVWILGAVFGTVNPQYTTDELVHVFEIMKPKVVLCYENSLKTVLEIRSEVPSIQTVISFGSGTVLTYKQMLNAVDSDVDWRIPVDLDSVAALLCSSGTTGVPKCVELKYKNFQRCLDSLLLFDPKPKTPQNTCLFLPQYHGFGLLLCLDGIVRRNHIVVFPRFEIFNFLENCEKFKINILLVVPPILVLLAKHPQVEKTDLSAVTEIRSGAAPVKPSLADEVIRRACKSALFLEGYGLTETCIIAAFPHPTQPRGSVGMVGAGMRIKVVDVVTGEALGAHEEGELWIQGETVMKGYRDNPGATAEALDSDGWFHTGDVGCYDQDGWIYVRDRIKELIKYNAMQVSPTELEALILKHPSVRDAAVWGKPDEAVGQLPMAFVVPQTDAQITAEEIQTFVAEHVSSHKKLRGGVEFVKEIPKTPSGKILRRLLPTLIPALSTP